MKRLRLILTILGLAVGMGVTALLIFFTFRPAAPLATVLPASRTVALFTRLRQEEIDRFAGFFPVLHEIPRTEGLLHVGLLRSDRGTEWVLQAETDAGLAPLSSPSMEVKALLAGQDARLDSLPAFRALAAGLPPGGGWAYADPAPILARASTPIDRWIATLLRDQQAIILVPEKQGFSLLTLSAGMPLREQAMMPGNEPASLTLSMAAPSDLGSLLLSTLPQADAAALRALLRTVAANALGDDVSPAYDLRPLLHGPAELRVRQTARGPLFVLRGRVQDLSSFKTLRERLLASARSPRAAVREEHRAFDRGFSMRLVRSDAALTKPVTFRQHGWDGEGIRTSGSGGIFVATRGAEFVIMNDEEQLATELSRPAGPSPAPGSRLLLAGNADAAFVRSVLSMTPLSSESTFFPGLATASGSWAWSVTQIGPVLRLTALAQAR